MREINIVAAITINNHFFKTKKSLDEYTRKLRDSYSNGQPLNDSDFDFMLNLLDRHEQSDIKIGCGVVSMYVKTNSVYKNSREFWLVRVDGSETDFSFKQCLKNETKLQKFKKACRVAVSSIVIDFKKDFFARFGESSTCPITGETMTSRHNSHVDHSYPNSFNQIIQDFIEAKALDVDKIELLTSRDGRIGSKMMDKTLEQQFVEFHNQRAKLRIISKLANLSQPKRSVVMKENVVFPEDGMPLFIGSEKEFKEDTRALSKKAKDIFFDESEKLIGKGF